MKNLDFKLDSKATSLSLDNNEIGDEGAEGLASVLPDAKSLTSLNLVKNRISAEGAVAIAEVLPRTGLTLLDLAQNRIGAEGEAAILTIATSNPCFVTEIYGLDNSDEINAVVGESLKQQAKIGALSLFNDHSFPAGVAVMMAGYVTSSVNDVNQIKKVCF